VSFDPTSYPYDTVVRVTMMFDGVRYQASGVLISPDEVLTAAHVVYSSDWGQATNIVVTPDYNQGSAPFGTYSGIATHYNPISDHNGTISLGVSQSDYAVIHLNKPVTGAGTMEILSNYQGGAVHITGYPGSGGGAMVDSQQSVTLDRHYSLFDGMDTKPGSSGGPVWLYGGDGLPDVVGLVSSGNGTKGYFVQITTGALNQIEAWVASDDATLAGNPGWIMIGGAFPGQIFTVGTGNTKIDASGYQHDTVVLHGSMDQYSVTADALNDPTLTDRISNRDYVVQTTGVEYFRFADQTVAAVNGANKLIAGLYQAALDRAPDVGGLSYWEDVYTNDLNPSVLAAGSTAALLSGPTGTQASISRPVRRFAGVPAGLRTIVEFRLHHATLSQCPSSRPRPGGPRLLAERHDERRRRRGFLCPGRGGGEFCRQRGESCQRHPRLVLGRLDSPDCPGPPSK